MAQTRRSRRRLSPYQRLLREITAIGLRLQRKSRDAAGVQTAYFRTLERLVAEARRTGHRLEVVFEPHGGRTISVPQDDAPRAMLRLIGAGAGRPSNSVFVADPAFLRCARV